MLLINYSNIFEVFHKRKQKLIFQDLNVSWNGEVGFCFGSVYRRRFLIDRVSCPEGLNSFCVVESFLFELILIELCIQFRWASSLEATMWS